MRLLLALVAALSVLVAPVPALAQPASASAGGRVSGSTGIGLPGATIRIRGDDGTDRVVISGDDGEYEVDGLVAGVTYSFRAELDGFAPVSETGVTLAGAARTNVSFLLIPTTTQVVAVTGRMTAPQPVSTIEATISDRLTHMLPLFGRDFLAVTSLAPGVVGNPNAPSTNGQLSWSNNVIVDGASHYSKWRSAARTFYSGYPLEAIQDVQVLTSQFAPEYGEALSSVTTARTRSGGNVPHGSVLVFGQSGALNDQPVFAARRPPASSIRVGATYGGPIAEDRTFVFGSYEGRRARSANIVASPVAPQAEVRNDEDEHLALVKLDHRQGSNDLVSFRYNGQWFTWVNENGGLWLPGSGQKYRNDVHTILASHTHLVSSRILHMARMQFARYSDLRTDLAPSLYVFRAGHSVQGGTYGQYGFGATPEDTWEAADAISYTNSSHALKFGSGLRYTRVYNEALPFGRGAYYFAGDPATFPQPYAFVQNVEASPDGHIVQPRSVGAYAFLQDEWRPTGRMSVSAGLRYDVEQVRNVRGYAATDTNNFQPRVSAAWNPAGNLMLRGGAGLYTQQHLLYYINRAQLEGPTGAAMVTLTPASPFMPTFPATVTVDILARIPRDLFVVDNAFRNPMSTQASLGVQHPLFGFQVSADYIYLSGRGLMSVIDANAPASIVKPTLRTVPQADATRPQAPGPGGVRKLITLGNEGRSWYHALQVKADRSFGRFQSLFTYTLARARDMANYQLPEDSRNLEAEKGRADNDVRHNVTAALTWELPFSRRGFSGWLLSAAGQFRSNRPYNITWGDDRNGTTQNDARPGGRNTGIGPAYRNVDLSLMRRIPVRGRTVELRAEAFNVFSTRNYDEIVGMLGSPLFGQPISAFPRRRLQVAAIVRY